MNYKLILVAFCIINLINEAHAQIKNGPNKNRSTSYCPPGLYGVLFHLLIDCKDLASYDQKVQDFIKEGKFILTDDLIKEILKIGSQKFGRSSLSKLLLRALKHGCKTIVELYIKINYLDIKDHNGYTPLLLACAEEKYNIAKWLVEEANVNINETTTDEKLTPLMIAIYRYNKRLIKLLINNGANLDLQDDKGDTALIIAAKCNYKDIVIKLINAGANQSIENNNGQTAGSIATINHIERDLHIR